MSTPDHDPVVSPQSPPAPASPASPGAGSAAVPGSIEDGSPAGRSHRRLFLGTAVAAMAAGAGIAAWNMSLDEPGPGAVEHFFSLSYPLASPDNAGNTEETATKFRLADLRGKAIVANFWATWCPPCVEEMPELSALAEKWTAQYGGKVAVIGVGVDNFANVQRFSVKKPVKYPLIATNTQGLDLLSKLGDEAGGLPFTVLISPQGKITGRILGRFKAPQLEQSLQKMLT